MRRFLGVVAVALLAAVLSGPVQAGLEHMRLAVERAWGGQILVDAATTGQAALKQADGSWQPGDLDDLVGTVPVAQGGTGATTAAGARTSLDVQQLDPDLTALAGATLTYGQIPIGGPSGTVSAATITTGTGITITPGAGSITIAATGGGAETLAATLTAGNTSGASDLVVDASQGLVVGGATTAGARLEVNAGTLAVREGDDTGPAPLHAGGLLLGTSAIASPTLGQITWDTGLGAIDHIQGAGDAALRIDAGAQNLELRVWDQACWAVSAVSGEFADTNGTRDLLLGNGSDLIWCSGTGIARAADAGLFRSAAGVIKITNGADGGTGDGRLNVHVGTVASPSLRNDDDTDSGIGFVGTGSVHVVADAVNRVTVLPPLNLTNNSAGRLFSVTTTTDSTVTLRFEVGLRSDDGADFVSVHESVLVSLVNDAGVLTAASPVESADRIEQKTDGTDTVATTYTVGVAGAVATINLNLNVTGMTPTTHRAFVTVTDNSGTAITP